MSSNEKGKEKDDRERKAPKEVWRKKSTSEEEQAESFYREEDGDSDSAMSLESNSGRKAKGPKFNRSKGKDQKQKVKASPGTHWDNTRIRNKLKARKTANAALNASLADMVAQKKAAEDALKDVLAAKKSEQEEEQEEEENEYKERVDRRAEGLKFWYEEEIPVSLSFIYIFLVIFGLTVAHLNYVTERQESPFDRWVDYLAMGATTLLPGFWGVGLGWLFDVVSYLHMGQHFFTALIWALTGTFPTSLIYCSLMGKRHFLWPKPKHTYMMLCQSNHAETEVDARADANARGDLKHVKARYARVTHTLQMGWYSEQQIITVSLEVFMQLTTPRTMNLLVDDALVKEKLVAAAGALDTVNVDRSLALSGYNVTSSTVQLAYGYYRHFRREAALVPFGQSPSNH